MTSPSHGTRSIGENELFEYLNIISLSGITEGHKKETTRALEKYLCYVNWNVDKVKSLEYFKKLQESCSISYYRKQMYQIMKFLNHYSIDWVNSIRLPPEPDYTPKKVTVDDIKDTIEYFSNDIFYKRYNSIILLGFTSGLRAEELYKLTTNDINLSDRVVYVKHEPKNNHSTKNKKSRVSFFTHEARDAIKDYIQYFYQNNVDSLYPQRTIERAFKDSPIRIKDLRKAFSQEWTRRFGDTGVKKILMGHSLRHDVDLMHYNYQSEADLKKIYDKVMGENTVLM